MAKDIKELMDKEDPEVLRKAGEDAIKLAEQFPPLPIEDTTKDTAISDWKADS